MGLLTRNEGMGLLTRNEGRSTGNMIWRLRGEKAIFIMHDLKQEAMVHF